MNIIELIAASQDKLSKGQKSIGAYIAQNLEQVCFMSLKEFSEATSTTAVSVLRFAKKLGLENYIGLKRELRTYVSQRLAPNDKLKTVIEAKSDHELDLMGEVIAADMEGIRRTCDLLDRDDVLRAVELLRRSDRVYLAAHSASVTLSTFLYNRLLTISVDTEQFDITNVTVMNTKLTKIKASDVFIVCAFSVYSKDILYLGRQLSNRGIPFICLTDSLTNRISEQATVSFPCATSTPVFYNSYSAAMVVANALTSVLALQMKDRFNDMRQQLSVLGEEYNSYLSGL